MMIRFLEQPPQLMQMLWFLSFAVAHVTAFSVTSTKSSSPVLLSFGGDRRIIIDHDNKNNYQHPRYSSLSTLSREMRSSRQSSTTRTILYTSVGNNNNNKEHDDDDGDEKKHSTSNCSSFSWSVNKIMTKEEGNDIITTSILPQQEYGTRIKYGGEYCVTAQQQQQQQQQQGSSSSSSSSSKLFTANDPSLSYTYGEFPTKGFDELIDIGMKYIQKNCNNNNNNNIAVTTTDTINMVDIGSGCGRLVFYTALTRGGGGGGDISSNDDGKATSPLWNIDGIEISNTLHEEAIRASQRGMESGWFQNNNNNNNKEPQKQPQPNNNSNKKSNANTFSLHVGDVASYANDILSNADIIFMYSTAFTSKVFLESMGAMILEDYWNILLSKHCKDGCIIISTDRALDPGYGFQCLERHDVPNDEVMGTTGFIHQFCATTEPS